MLKFQGIREIKSKISKRIFPWRSATHWRLVPNGSNRCDLSLCKVHHVTHVQYDHDDRGLCNLVPAMSLNRIVPRLSRSNTAVSSVIKCQDNKSTHITSFSVFTCIVSSKWIMTFSNNRTLYHI